MDLSYTPEQEAFRAEVREWLAEHVPATPLSSFDTEAGFAAHREWERTLAAGNWGMVTWPEAFRPENLPIYVKFHAESEFQVEKAGKLYPDLEN